MSKSRSLRLVQLLAFLPISASCVELKGIELGMDAPAFNAAAPLASCDSHEKPFQCFWNTTLGGVSTHMSIVFDNERVAMITAAAIDPDDFSGLTKALRGKFGKPTAAQNSIVQNGFGATFDQQVIVWRGKGWELSARKRSSTLTESSVILASLPYLARFESKSDASDL